MSLAGLISRVGFGTLLRNTNLKGAQIALVLCLVLAGPALANFTGANVRQHPEWFPDMFLEKRSIDQRMAICLKEISKNRRVTSHICTETIKIFNDVLKENQFGEIGENEDDLILIEKLIELILSKHDLK